MIAVLYFVLFWRFSFGVRKANNIFYERDFEFSLVPFTLYLNSHYLCAHDDEEEPERTSDHLIFYFCMNCIEEEEEEEKTDIVPFHQCQVVCVVSLTF